MTLDTKAIWERAIPLHRAFLYFAPAAEKARYEQLAAESSVSAIVQRLQAGQVSLADAVGPYSERGKVANRLRALCLRYIKDGYLRAYGFDAPRRSDDLPREIPNELWEFAVFWDKDKLVGNGLEMVAVRLIPLQWITHLEDVSTEPTRRQGRPSRDNEIVNTWNELVAEGKIDFGGTRANACKLVRERILKLFPDQGEAGLGDKALYRKLKPLWDKATE